jgi:catalase
MVRGGPSVLFDAVILLGGETPPPEFLREAAAQNFAGDAFKHLKAIACDSGGRQLLASAGVGPDEFDDGVIALNGGGEGLAAFIEAAKQHRIWTREARVMAEV